MFGISEAKKILEENIHERPVLLYGDPDVDGLISLLFMAQFCDMMGVKYSYYVNSNRFHGFAQDPRSLRGYLVICADFSISGELLQSLVDNDVRVVSIDHHDIGDVGLLAMDNKDQVHGVIINNQYSFEPDDERYNSGAGVVYEVFKEMYPEFESDERKALVGVTLLSDVRPIENDKAKKYLKKLYTIDYHTGYFKYLLNETGADSFGFGEPVVDRNFIDYTLSPKINSLLRFNKTAEAIDFIFGKGLPSTDYKTRQSDFISVMLERAQYLYLNSLHILAFDRASLSDFPDANPTNFIGYAISQYKDSHNNVSTLGFCIDNGRVVRTSFRGKYGDLPYRYSFKSIGLKAEGHPTAFGVNDFYPTPEIWQSLDEIVYELEEGHQVTETIKEVSSLSNYKINYAMKDATYNSYVRDIYRRYVRYTGHNAKIVKETFHVEPFTEEDYRAGRKPDKVKGKEYFKYVRDSFGNPKRKYIEYMIDGISVKSFGVLLEDGLILPTLGRTYVEYYIKSDFS